MALRGKGRDLLGNETETLRPGVSGAGFSFALWGLCKVPEPLASKTPTAMASSPCPPSPLFVRLPESISWAHRKLEKYFQCRDSEGGECSVQPVGPSAPNAFQVNFLERAGELEFQNWAKVWFKGRPCRCPNRPTGVWHCLWEPLPPTDYLHSTVGDRALDVSSP